MQTIVILLTVLNTFNFSIIIAALVLFKVQHNVLKISNINKIRVSWRWLVARTMSSNVPKALTIVAPDVVIIAALAMRLLRLMTRTWFIRLFLVLTLGAI